MHLGTGEEAIIAGVVSQMLPDDAMAVDHRGSAAFLMRGVDPVALLRELLGRGDGLCGGQGGHMHLFSKAHLAATTGIVGAGGPIAAGFGLAAQMLRPGSVAVAFFGEGALDQGMLLESIHLAVTWKLPVIFVCKDDGWAITTRTTAEKFVGAEQKASLLGAPYQNVDGLDVEQVWLAAGKAMDRARRGEGPAFLRARCVHLEGHFLGFQLLRMIRNPLGEQPRVIGPLIGAFLHPRGGRLSQRLAGMRYILSTTRATLRDPRRAAANDPVLRARHRLLAEAGMHADPARLDELDRLLQSEVAATVAAARLEAAV